MTTPPDTVSAIAVAERAFAALAAGGPDQLLSQYDELFSEDFEWWPVLIGTLEGETSFTGRADYEQFWRDFGAVFADPEWVPTSFEHLDHGSVLVVAQMHALGAVSGVPIDQEVAFIVDVRDGRICSGRSFFSRADAEEYAAHA